jgi:hypothetical protein
VYYYALGTVSQRSFVLLGFHYVSLAHPSTIEASPNICAGWLCFPTSLLAYHRMLGGISSLDRKKKITFSPNHPQVSTS